MVIVSRDADALQTAKCIAIHEVAFLSPELALELFMTYAKEVPSGVSLELVDAIVRNCANLPLSLKVTLC